MQYFLLTIAVIVLPFAGLTLEILFTKWRFRKNAPPKVISAVGTMPCPWCSSASLHWDRQLRPPIESLGGKRCMAVLLLRCEACGRKSAFEVYSDFSMWRIHFPYPTPMSRRCLACGYYFRGNEKTACEQCGTTNSREVEPMPRRSCPICEDEIDARSAVCPGCTIPLQEA